MASKLMLMFMSGTCRGLGLDATKPSTRMYLAWTSALYELPQTGCLHTPQGQQSLSSLGRIPKRIWIAWIDPRIEDHEPDHPFVKYGIGRLRTQNRGWELTIADDAAINAELRKHLPLLDYALVRLRHAVERTDLWRLLVLYHYGGVYVDLDEPVNRPLSSVLRNSSVLLARFGWHDYQQSIMASAPHNPLFARAIERNLAARRRGGITGVLGPPLYYFTVLEVMCCEHSVHEALLHRQASLERCARVLERAPFVRSYAVDPSSRLLWHGNRSQYALESGKWPLYRDGLTAKRWLYRKYGLAPWNAMGVHQLREVPWHLVLPLLLLGLLTMLSCWRSARRRAGYSVGL